MIGNKHLLLVRNSWPVAGCTFSSLPSYIAHEFGTSDRCTKQCVAPESISARLAAPSSCTESSNNEHSAGAGAELDNLRTYFVVFFGFWMHGVLLFLFVVLFVAMFGASLAVWRPSGLPARATSTFKPKKQLSFKHCPTSLAPTFFTSFLPQLKCNFSQLVFQRC